MKTLKSICEQYETKYQAAKALGIQQTQLNRWLAAGALVDDAGNIYIKSPGKIKVD